MNMFADLMLYPGGVLAWLFMGLIAGWLAGWVMKSGGYGIIGNMIIGLIGAVIGGFLFGQLMAGEIGFWGSIGIAFIGACILIAIVRFLAPGRSRL